MVMMVNCLYYVDGEFGRTDRSEVALQRTDLVHPVNSVHTLDTSPQK